MTMNTLDALDNITRLALGNAERVDAAIARAEAAEADAADYKQRWQDMMDALLAVDKQRKAAEAERDEAKADADKLGWRVAEWIDKAHAAQAEADRLRRELGLMTAAHESQTLNLENGRYVLSAAEHEVARLRAVCRMALGVVDPSADPVDPMTLWNAIEDVLA